MFNLLLQQVSTQHNTRSVISSQKFDSIEQWEEYKEVIPDFHETPLIKSKKIVRANEYNKRYI